MFLTNMHTDRGPWQTPNSPPTMAFTCTLLCIEKEAGRPQVRVQAPQLLLLLQPLR